MDWEGEREVAMEDMVEGKETKYSGEGEEEENNND